MNLVPDLKCIRLKMIWKEETWQQDGLYDKYNNI